MTDVNPTVLVLGATGRQGGAVARALIGRGCPVRAMVRNTGSAAASALRALGADLIQGSFDEAEGLRAAMRGVHGVFSVLPGALPDGEEVRFGTAIADVAAASGVGHLVYSSGASVGGAPTGIARFDAKPLVEAHVRALPIPWTIVRPMIFMEMLLAPGMKLGDRFTFLVRPDQAMQLVAVDDIGRLVAAILTDPTRFVGQTVTLAGDTVTGDDLAAALSTALGRPIGYARFPDAVLADKPDFARMAASIEDGPLSRFADLDRMRSLDPQLLSLPKWLAGPGRVALEVSNAAAAG